ncbi:glycosyltransferase [Mycobacterium haemophilum]|uniref:Glycosyl transferase n=1 Tax=Mycobacterium haemophilum TaxID=29311 RepID=A0A0I9TVF9_9MYCO|nr:glycosyltransferase [Mycobacterium haemophilum]KLO32793.1 glycosyl transferase [Mycobacterium haemophilum]KLO37095.1 glycosyl transferase [Mycobacterium haemophilum]KLO43568.1 glycosyl transferase [Mycobacterium haemophilum]KLO55926.1 glycosyl transferase [Mycobacterium haemophilum]
MKFALAVHGTRGDVEPCAAVGLELLRRGHDVRMAVPPNLVEFTESIGLAAFAYGPDSQAQLDEDLFQNLWKVRNPIGVLHAGTEYITRGWAEMSTALTVLADGADLILHGQTYQGVAANIAEYYGIPMAALHHFPHRVNGQLLPVVPPSLIRTTMKVGEWIYWRMTKAAEDAQRSDLGMAKSLTSSVRRIAERGSLEIQAYEELYFPGLATEWGSRRPFVGALTLELPTDTDDEVASWIAAGTPPIYFGFGSMRVESPADTVAMISEACAQLGERALICSGASNFNDLPHRDHVKVVREVNHAAVLPTCRAVVHHGGAGTTAAGMRAGIPTLVLWIGAEQPIWAAQVKRLKAGTSRRFASATRKSLIADLRRILMPQYVARAREIATLMTKPTASITRTADLLEQSARLGV